MTETEPLYDAVKVRDSLLMLGDASCDLNGASDDMNASMKSIEAAIKASSPGAAAWVTLSRTESGVETALGYAKVNGAWGFAMRRRTQEEGEGRPVSDETWPFCEAPRWMRADSVHLLPELLDALLRNVRDMTEKMRKKSAFVRGLADAVKEADDAQGNR